MYTHKHTHAQIQKLQTKVILRNQLHAGLPGLKIVLVRIVACNWLFTIANYYNLIHARL